MSRATKLLERWIAENGKTSTLLYPHVIGGARPTWRDLRAVVALAKRTEAAEREAEGQRHVATQRGRALMHFYRIAARAHDESLLDGEPDSFYGRLRAACEATVLRSLAPRATKDATRWAGRKKRRRGTSEGA